MSTSMFWGKERTDEEIVELMKSEAKLDKDCQGLFDLIYNSTLDIPFKVDMLCRFVVSGEVDLDYLLTGGGFEVYSETCFEFLEKNGMEVDAAGRAFLKDHFDKNLKNFPYPIITENGEPIEYLR